MNVISVTSTEIELVGIHGRRTAEGGWGSSRNRTSEQVDKYRLGWNAEARVMSTWVYEFVQPSVPVTHASVMEAKGGVGVVYYR